MYKGIIFDLDGTLLDTIEDLGDSVNTALKTLGYPLRTLDEYKLFVGDGFKMLVNRALPHEVKQDAAINEKAVDIFKDAYSKCYLNKTLPYEGIISLVEELSKRGVPMTVCSNKRESYTKNLIDKFFKKGTFIEVFGEAEDIRPKKPDPAGPMELSGLMGAEPSDIILIGDTKVDMNTAKAAGMVPVGVSWGFRAVEELKENGAALIVDSPEEILRLFA